MIHDPHRIALRNGLRLAIVVPALCAGFLAVSSDDLPALFAAFGSFSLTVFGDFGGPLRPRLLAYLGATLAGIPLIAVGALVEQVLWVSVLGTAVVGFGLTALSGLGGYVSAARAPLLLGYVLSASISGGAATIDGRVVGWVVGGAVAGVVAVTLWPVVLWSRAERLAAEVCTQVADVLTDAGEGSLDALRASVEELRRVRSSEPEPRAEPTARGRGLALLLVDLARIDVFPGRVALARLDPGVDGPLVDATATLFREVGAYLLGDAPQPDLRTYSEARRQHFEAVVGSFGQEVATRAQDVFPMRLLSFMAMNVCAHAVISRGGTPDLDDEEFNVDQFDAEPGAAAAWRRGSRLLATSTAPDSAAFRWAVRSAVGLAAATLVAGLMDVQHAFWVVLAVFAVLRSDASGTERTAVEAIGGTLVGFVVAATLVSFADGNRTVLWIALPLVVFLAAWAGKAIHFAAGQGAFTLFVVVLFDLISPGGWHTGLIRVEDVLIGAGTAVAVGILLWPGGAARQVGRLCAEAIRREAEAFVEAVGELTGGASAVAARIRARRTASIRARGALGIALGERRGPAVGAQVCANAVWASGVFGLGSDTSISLAQRYGPIEAWAGAADLVDAAGDIRRRSDALADRLERGARDLTVTEDAPAAMRPIASAGTDAVSPVDAVRVVWTRCWIAELDGVLARFGA